MATAQNIITRAYRIANILSEIETPSSEQGADGLSLLNGMLAKFKADNLDVGAVPLTAQGDVISPSVAISDALPPLLAARLAAETGVSLTPEAIGMITEAKEFILRQSLDITPMSATHLPRGTQNGYDISNG